MKQKHAEKFSDEALIAAYNETPFLGRLAAQFKVPHITIFRRSQKLGLVFVNGGYRKAIPLEEIINGLHPYYPTFKLKGRLLKEQLLLNECDICKISSWNNKPINLQLDHIDGDSSNHNMSNLRLLCPNCHSQTSTYCGKNKWVV